MNRWEAKDFWEHWEEELAWEQDSRVAVLFFCQDDWERLPSAFRETMMWRWQVLPLEVAVRPEEGWQEDTVRKEKKIRVIREAERQLKAWNPSYLVVVGDFLFQQWSAAFVEEISSFCPVCVHLLTGSDLQVAGSGDVWLRDRRGETYYRKRIERERDLWVMLQKMGPLEQEIAAWRNELFGECGRDLLVELAEPLLILYGVPIEIGGYFVLRYLFCVWEKETDEPGRWEKAYRDLVLLGQRERRVEIESLLIPEKNLPLLIRMAADGIRNLPEGQMPDQIVIEGFYHTFCYGS